MKSFDKERDTKKYFFKDLIFPRVLDINNSGIIVSRNFNNLNNNAMKMRLVYLFEDFYVKLYEQTVLKIGKKEAMDLWYKMGKSLGVRYFLFNGVGTVPFSKRSLAIEFFQNISMVVGMSYCEKVKYDLSKNSFVFWGENNVISRKIKDSSHVNGIIAGVISFIMRENFESTSKFSKDFKFCNITVSDKIKRIYFPDFFSLKVNPKYNLNFNFTNKNKNGYYSFSDVLRFNLVKMNSLNKFYFNSYSLFPSEISLAELIAKIYSDSGLEDLFKDVAISFIENLAVEIFGKLDNRENKKKLFKSLFSAFGFGKICFKKKSDRVLVYFLDPVFTEFGLNHSRSMINGFLNYFYGERYDFKFDNKSILRKRDYFVFFRK